ncbi:MAG: hypothetical protein M0R21_11920 [Lentimicrobiaceae bacterium]|nr:hypothetical protein [Lentimicrobiaceae bacterium]
MAFPDLINSMGVFLILLAYFLLTFKWIPSGSAIYLLMNLIGSALACYGSFLIHSIPFFILEGTWAAVSLVGFIKLLRT